MADVNYSVTFISFSLCWRNYLSLVSVDMLFLHNDTILILVALLLFPGGALSFWSNPWGFSWLSISWFIWLMLYSKFSLSRLLTCPSLAMLPLAMLPLAILPLAMLPPEMLAESATTLIGTCRLPPEMLFVSTCCPWTLSWTLGAILLVSPPNASDLKLTIDFCLCLICGLLAKTLLFWYAQSLAHRPHWPPYGTIVRPVIYLFPFQYHFLKVTCGVLSLSQSTFSSSRCPFVSLFRITRKHGFCTNHVPRTHCQHSFRVTSKSCNCVIMNR